MKFVIFNLMAAAAILYLVGGQTSEGAGRVATKVTAIVQKAVSEGRRLAVPVGTAEARRGAAENPPAQGAPVAGPPAPPAQSSKTAEAASQLGPAAPGPPENPAAAGTSAKAPAVAETTGVAPWVAEPDLAIAKNSKASAPLDAAVAKRRAEVLGEATGTPAFKAPGNAPGSASGFMSKRERARELHRLAEEMEYVYVGKVIAR